MSEIKRGRGRPRKKPGDPVEKTQASLEVDRLIKETLDQETDVDKETVLRRLSKAPGMSGHHGGMSLKPDEGGKITVSDLIKKNMMLARMPDIDMTDPEQVGKRLDEYFAIEESFGNRPTVGGMAMCLNGMNRATLWQIVNDNMGNTRGVLSRLPISVTTLIKKYYATLGNLWEDYMQSGKINPVSGIFLGKNNYGYRDQTEYVLTPNTQTDFSEKEIRDRLGLTDSDSDSDRLPTP